MHRTINSRVSPEDSGGISFQTTSGAAAIDRTVQPAASAAKSDRRSVGLFDRYKRLSTGKKAIVVVFLIWAAQAVPKWTAAITADGELSAQIMKVFITPKGIGN